MASLLQLGTSLVRAASAILSPARAASVERAAAPSMAGATAAPPPPRAPPPAPRDDNASAVIELRAQLAVASRERDAARAEIAALHATASAASSSSSSATAPSSGAAAGSAAGSGRAARASAPRASASRARLARDEDATALLLGLLAMGRTHPRLMAEGCDDKDVLESLGVPVSAIRYALREDVTSFAHGIVAGLKGVTPAVFAATAADGAYASALASFLASDPVIDVAADDDVSRAARDMRLLQFVMIGVFRLADADFPYALSSALKSETVAAALRDACDDHGADVRASSTLAQAFSALRARCGLRAPRTAAEALPERGCRGVARAHRGDEGRARAAKRSAAELDSGAACAAGADAESDGDSDGGFGAVKKGKGGKGR